MKIIDCSGLNCPIPVINTKKAFSEIEEGTMVIIVDNNIAKINIEKFAKGSGLEFLTEDKDEKFHITITKKNVKIESNVEKKDEKFTIIIASEFMGNGDEDLGRILMKGYIFALSESENKPTDILMYNSGVKIASEDSSVVESLQKLKCEGVNIQVCGTCLDFYGIKEKLAVGEISNMYSIVETMNSSDKVVRI